MHPRQSCPEEGEPLPRRNSSHSPKPSDGSRRIIPARGFPDLTVRSLRSSIENPFSEPTQNDLARRGICSCGSEYLPYSDAYRMQGLAAPRTGVARGAAELGHVLNRVVFGDS